MDGGGGAARHVGPPRTLDVQQFAAARSSEVQALYGALKAHEEELSGAVRQSSSSLTTPRHLRRRTASHNRRLPFRWRHNAARTGTKKKEKNEEEEKASSSVVQSNVAPTASEEESSRKRKASEKRIPSRRVRRRIEFQKLRDGTAVCMRNGTRRLATHVWHAKRFPMTKTWGYCLPEGLPGRGRGSKAVFNWVKEAAVLHDSSYMGLIELQGTEDAILGVLCATLEPPPRRPMSGSRLGEEEMHGLLYGNAVLHDVGKAPREGIAPVTTLWRPFSSSERRGEDELSTAEKGATEERQLWMWVHPGAFDRAFLALSTACERQVMDDRQASVKCRFRSGELARLDILGSRALQVLQKVLRPVPRKLANPGGSEVERGVSGHEDVTTNAHSSATTPADVSQPLSVRIFAKADCLPGAAVLALDVCDPRDTPRSFYAPSFSENAPNAVIDGNLADDEEALAQDKNPIVDIIEDEALPHWENFVKNGLCNEVSDSPYLWSPEAERKVAAALSQKAFSEKRRKRRKAFFTDINADFLHSNWEVEQSGACPVLLLKRAHSRLSASGWSIIMPITWVHAFWVPLVFAGGHVIGLRERHWLATDAGLPYFPHDFPDCPAHAQQLEIESAAFNSANQARPPAKRSPCFTVSPLQRSVIDAYRDRLPPVGSGRPAVAAVGSELTDEKKHGEQLMDEERAVLNGVSGLTDPDGDTAMTEADSSAARAAHPPANSPQPNAPLAEKLANEAGLPLNTTDLPQNTVPPQKIIPNLDRDSAMTGIGVTVSISLDLTALCQPLDGPNVTEITKPPGGDNSAREEDEVSPEGAPSSSAAASHGVDGAVTVTEFTPHFDGDSVITPGFDKSVPQTPSSETAHRSAETGHVQQSATPLDDTETPPTWGLDPSPTAPLLQQPVLDAHSGEEAIVVTQATELFSRDFEEPEIQENVTRSGGRGETFLLPAISSGDNVSPGLTAVMKSTTEQSPLPVFVARTVDALMQVFRCAGLGHAVLLCTGLMKNGGVQNGLRKGTLEWRASHDERPLEGVGGGPPVQGCCVRVLIRVPRKGVMQQNGVLCSPSRDDFDAFLNRSQQWQGVETSWLNPKAEDPQKTKGKRKEKRKRKGKGKGETEGEAAKPSTFQSEAGAEDFEKSTTPFDVGCDQCGTREAIGCITSTGPQGSVWSGVGFCDFSSLMKKRAMQWQDRRWWKKKEIFLLAGSKLSPILRPVLVSIVLESGPEQDILW